MGFWLQLADLMVVDEKAAISHTTGENHPRDAAATQNHNAALTPLSSRFCLLTPWGSRFCTAFLKNPSQSRLVNGGFNRGFPEQNLLRFVLR